MEEKLTMSDTETIELPSETIANYVLTQAIEDPDEWNEYTEDGVEYDLTDVLDDPFVESVVDEEYGRAVHVGGVITGRGQRQTTRARRNPPGKAHPAEYETVEVKIEVIVEWFPEMNDGLGGTYVLIDQHGAVNPEVY